MGILGPLFNSKSDLSVRNGVLLYKQLIRPMKDYAAPLGGPLPAVMSGGYRSAIQVSPSCYRRPLVRK